MMMAFSALPVWLEALAGIFSALLFLTGMLLGGLFMHIGGKGYAAATLPVSAVMYGLFQAVCIQCSGSEVLTPWERIGERGMQLPAAVIWLVILLAVVIEYVQFRCYLRWSRTHLSELAIKQAMDTLPVGICFFDAEGRVRLKNRAIDRVCCELMQEPLLNGIAFSECVDRAVRQMEGRDFVILPDGKAYVITKDTLHNQDDPLFMITAADITEEYEQTRTLARKQEELGELNKRLLDHNQEIVSVITEREILNAKIQIHDEIGSVLLATRRYVVNGGAPAELEAIKEVLNKNVSSLRQQSRRAEPDEYAQLVATAEKLDVHIRVTGTLPERQPARHIAATAIHECLTNTIRHAQGDTLSVTVSDTPTALQMTFTNNGKAPTQEIEEKGGLAYLRNLTEESGGRMIISARPVFQLTILLNKEEE